MRRTLSDDCGFRISDCRFHSRRPYRSDDHGENLVGLIQQHRKTALLHNASFYEQFHPIRTLVTFFFNNTHLGGEIRRRSCPARCSIVGTDRCSASKQLSANYICCTRSRQCIDQLNDTEGKRFRSLLEFIRIHSDLRYLRIRNQQSAIRNCQSACTSMSAPRERISVTNSGKVTLMASALSITHGSGMPMAANDRAMTRR